MARKTRVGQRKQGRAEGRRSYEQYCGLALALDRIGDRWTLLIVRELLYLGPRRFTDLRGALPGIASNLLTERLRDLARHDLVSKRQLPPPAPAAVYELTELGLGLEPAVFALLSWGVQFAGEPEATTDIRPELPLMALRAAFRAHDAAGVHETYQLRIDDRVFELVVADGALELHEGETHSPEIVLETDIQTFAALAAGRVKAMAILADGRMVFRGTESGARNFLRIFARGGEPE